MDVLRLDPTTMKPDALVEGWSSMIWTERYSSLGEFVMKTPLVSEARALIPEGSFISLLDSEEIMQVEMHSIEPNDKGGVENTITGSSFPANFLNERDTTSRAINYGEEFPTQWQLRRYYPPWQAASLLLWANLVRNDWPIALPAEALNGDPIDASFGWQIGDSRLLIPNLEITFMNLKTWVDPDPDLSSDDENPDPAHLRKWVVDRGELMKPISDLLATAEMGIRSRRPIGLATNRISFSSAGDPVTGITFLDNKYALEIYNGVDRTDYLTFRYDAGQIEKPKYLYSIKGYKNVVHASSAQGAQIVAAPGVDPNISGVNRRVLSYDAGDLAHMDPEGYFGQEDWNRVIRQKALVELQKYNKVALFDGEVSPLSEIKYNWDYYLGDRVTLQAEYDLEATMLVSEYIRSQDENGETSYPTLSLVED